MTPSAPGLFLDFQMRKQIKIEAMERALTEVAKFLTLHEVLLQFQLVSTFLKCIALKDEVLLSFLPDESKSSPVLSLYQRVKVVFSSTRYLLNVANAQMSVWDLETDSTRVHTSPLFLNSSRYVLSSMSTAIVTGGINHYKSCVKVNLETGAIEPLPDLLHDRAWHGITILNKEVYVSGGEINGETGNTAEKYSQGRWLELLPMQKRRYNHTLSGFQSKVYAFGGSDTYYLDSIEAFDGACWTRLKMKLPSPSCYPSIVNKGNSILIIGGFILGSSKRRVDLLKLSSKTWTEVCSIDADYSLSNAAALRHDTFFIYNHDGKQISIPMKLATN